MTCVERQLSETKYKWLVGQGVKTLPSHGRIMGSIPVRAAHLRDRFLSLFFARSDHAAREEETGDGSEETQNRPLAPPRYVFLSTRHFNMNIVCFPIFLYYI